MFFVLVVFVFARVASFESVFCCGGAWGVLLASFCRCQTCECMLLKESPAAAPSNSVFYLSSLSCPCLVLFGVSRTHACAVPARACAHRVCGPLHSPGICLLPLSYLILSYLYLSLSVFYLCNPYFLTCKSCSASSDFNCLLLPFTCTYC